MYPGISDFASLGLSFLSGNGALKSHKWDIWRIHFNGPSEAFGVCTRNKWASGHFLGPSVSPTPPTLDVKGKDFFLFIYEIPFESRVWPGA